MHTQCTWVKYKFPLLILVFKIRSCITSNCGSNLVFPKHCHVSVTNQAGVYEQTSSWVTGVTWRASDWCFGRFDVISVNRFRPRFLLFHPLRPRLDDCVHVLHQLQLLPPHVLLPDELSPRPLVLFLLTLFFSFPSKKPNGWLSHFVYQIQMTLERVTMFDRKKVFQNLGGNIIGLKCPWEYLNF